MRCGFCSLTERTLTCYADSTVRLKYFHPVRVYSAILNDEADLGVISYPKSRRDLRVIPWREEEMVLTCPRVIPESCGLTFHEKAACPFLGLNKKPPKAGRKDTPDEEGIRSIRCLRFW